MWQLGLLALWGAAITAPQPRFSNYTVFYLLFTGVVFTLVGSQVWQ